MVIAQDIIRVLVQLDGVDSLVLFLFAMESMQQMQQFVVETVPASITITAAVTLEGSVLLVGTLFATVLHQQVIQCALDMVLAVHQKHVVAPLVGMV